MPVHLTGLSRYKEATRRLPSPTSELTECFPTPLSPGFPVIIKDKKPPNNNNSILWCWFIPLMGGVCLWTQRGGWESSEVGGVTVCIMKLLIFSSSCFCCQKSPIIFTILRGSAAPVYCASVHQWTCGGKHTDKKTFIWVITLPIDSSSTLEQEAVSYV